MGDETSRFVLVRGPRRVERRISGREGPACGSAIGPSLIASGQGKSVGPTWEKDKVQH